MARKRTPTKQVNDRIQLSKENSNKSTRETSSNGENVKQSKPCLKASHLTFVTILLTLTTAAVCYSVYPELTSLMDIRRTPMPSLRNIVDSKKDSRVISKRDIGEHVISDAIQTNRESASIPFIDQVPNMLEVSDEELAKLAAKIMQLKTRHVAGSENVPLSEGMDNLNSADVKVKRDNSVQSESEILNDLKSQVQISVNDSNNDDINQETKGQLSNSDAVEAILSEDGKLWSDNSASKSDRVDKNASTVVSKDENVQMQALASSENKVYVGHKNALLNEEKSTKTGPIILSADSPHISLGFNDIQSVSTAERERKSTHKKGLGSKQTKQKEFKIRSEEKNSERISTKEIVDRSQLPNTAKENAKKNFGKNDKTKKQSTDASSTLHAGSKSSDTDFKPSFQRTFTPKKTFYGGRRIAPVELLNQQPTNSSVKVYLFDDFLSQQECEGLMNVHNNHVRAHTKQPILCFDSLNTLRKHIRDAGKKITVTSKVFTEGTSCVNESFSLQLQSWLNSNWSYSTAFYPGESKFSTNVAGRLQQSMGLKPENGGKFQITSYPLGKAYKTHTDCTIGSVDKRDRVISVLMYLNDAEEGGETKFPDLGIWVKPKRGRAIVWNNMSPSGVCEPHSRHAASVVKKGKKYILIRWYYYKSFQGLGHRPTPPHLPVRDDDQALVSCDDYDNGSCRWYDEWTYEHLLEYQQNKLYLS
ncbi:hypothetical protein EGW08_023073 [Elysia chlorotica]|uniref:Fe2OG dioxygenase domain-containing protein n=1 Tax=Elysia chlorotica TaxID=188477 RepID=A0A3S0Z4F5_ELYCH|nr:hypothetical protein EGW08_023073 [Elysia chlorotica]